MTRAKINTTQLPLAFTLPASDWTPPPELPDLRGREEVAIDTETKDDSLAQDRGPGWAYGAGRVVGVSWSAEGSSGYAPIAHPDSPNFDKAQVGRWLKDLVRSGTRLVFQNAPYDVGWIWAEWGLDVDGPIDDTLAMSFMENENHLLYNLDAICGRAGIPGKDEALLREAGEAFLRPAHAARGWKLTRSALKANLWRLPARFVGPYAETDAVRTRQARGALQGAIEAQGLMDAYRLEMDLVPVIRAMRARGIKIDTDLAEQHETRFLRLRDETLKEIGRGLASRRTPSIDDLQTNSWMDPNFRAEGIQAPLTATRKSSYSKDWMEHHDHWLPKLCVQADMYHMAATKFLRGFLMDYSHRGRLHAEIHQYKSDDGGTVSYRFSYSDPPLQQMPSPDINPDVGGAVRECFVADDGEVWGCCDYSQQEYRLTAHFAAACKVRGGEEAAEVYRVDPDIDYHKFVAGLTGLTRAKAKIQNFALLYGQGKRATAEALNMTIDDAVALRKVVEDKAPFGPALADYVKRRANAKGYIRLLDGARCRFPDWEVGFLDDARRAEARETRAAVGPCSRDEAQRRVRDQGHPWRGLRLRRAGTNKAMNRLIQGSAARQTKLAMRACAREKIPMILQMHDELNASGPPGTAVAMGEIMRTVVPLRVPMKVDAHEGPNWRAAKGK